MTEHRPVEAAPAPVKLRVEDYLLLDEVGALRSYGRTELIEGEILPMSPQHRPHGRILFELSVRLREALRDAGLAYDVLPEVSVDMSPHNAPQPDIVVTAEPDGEGLVPLPSVPLVVEVADSTLQSDLTRKATIYAQAGVPEYWVADIRGRVVHQMWSADTGHYAERRTIPFGTPVTAATLPALTVASDGL